MKNTITPGSAFDPAFRSQVDFSDESRRKQHIASEARAKQLAKGNTGTIFGLSAKSDAQIAKTARIRKSSALG